AGWCRPADERFAVDDALNDDALNDDAYIIAIFGEHRIARHAGAGTPVARRRRTTRRNRCPEPAEFGDRGEDVASKKSDSPCPSPNGVDGRRTWLVHRRPGGSPLSEVGPGNDFSVRHATSGAITSANNQASAVSGTRTCTRSPEMTSTLPRA